VVVKFCQAGLNDISFGEILVSFWFPPDIFNRQGRQEGNYSLFGMFFHTPYPFISGAYLPYYILYVK
jgi:hypothetical protein